MLPPLQRTDESLVNLLNDPGKGLPPQTEFPEQPYKPGLSLTYVGQPSLAVGVPSSAPTLAAGRRCTSATCWATATW